MKIGMETNQLISDGLQRFQEAREMARERTKRTNSRQRLVDLINRKKANSGMSLELSQNKPVTTDAGVSVEMSSLINKTLKKANELLLYTSDSKPADRQQGTKKLGNYIDMVA
ncbi:hypothetical protein ACFL5V_08140 [Fibrobacterota bacterium]